MSQSIELRRILPQIGKIEEAKIFGSENNVLGWHATVRDLSGRPIGGGTAGTQEEARRIAISEAFERQVVESLRTSSSGIEYQYDVVPTTCGSAAGFETGKVRLRAIAEATERWLWSMWIDQKFKLPSIVVEHKDLTALAQHFASCFERIHYFRKDLTIKAGAQVLNFRAGIVVAETQFGVFPGSRLGAIGDDLWTHALTEAWRHLQIFSKGSERPDIAHFLRDRIAFFGDNKISAFSQMADATKLDWPTPKLMLLKEFKTGKLEPKFWRALCEDYTPWHLGERDRFVY